VSSNRPTRPRQRIRPLPPGQSLFTPDASAARAATERRSAKPLIYLHQLPPWVVPILMAGLLVAGLALRGPAGAVALVVLAGLLGWLASVSWPRLSAGGRLGRLAAVGLLLALAAFQATR
jgi:hypothetical protein